jgi:Fe2+ or Zn2+ uptake regulation protein
MKTIQLTDEAYETLLLIKNLFTIKLHAITNQEMLRYIETVQDKEHFTCNVCKAFNDKEIDYEPEFTFSQMLMNLIQSTLNEQETGKVNFIT